MKDRVNVSIDQYLKASFEATQDLHHKTFTEVLEEGIRQIMSEVSPLESVKRIINEREIELSILKSQAAEIELLEKQQKKIAKESIPSNGVWDQKREELFVVGAGTVMNMLKRNQTPAWKNFYMKYGFESAKEIEIFVRTEAIKRGIL